MKHGAAIFATTFSDGSLAIEKCDPYREGYNECFSYLAGEGEEGRLAGNPGRQESPGSPSIQVPLGELPHFSGGTDWRHRRFWGTEARGPTAFSLFALWGGLSLAADVEQNMGLMNNGVVYALWDYSAEFNDELSFREGEPVTVLRRDGQEELDWWWASLYGQEGYVPKNYFGVSFEDEEVCPGGTQALRAEQAGSVCPAFQPPVGLPAWSAMAFLAPHGPFLSQLFPRVRPQQQKT